MIELMIYKGESLKYKPSVLGSATLFVALNLFEKETFDSQAGELYSKFIKMSLSDRFKLGETCKEILKITRSAFGKEEEVSSAVFAKFKKGYYGEVSQALTRV